MEGFVISLFVQKMWGWTRRFFEKWFGPLICFFSVLIWLELNLVAAILGMVCGHEHIWTGLVYLAGTVLALISFYAFIAWLGPCQSA